MISIIIEDNLQVDGRRHITEQHTDEHGRKHLVNYPAEASTDVQTVMLARVPYLEQDLVNNDIETSLHRLEDGENPLTMEFDYCTAKQAARKMILYAMENKAPWLLLLLKPLVEYLKQTYTATQIANYLGITVEQLTRIWARYNAILDQEAFLLADTDLAEAIDG